MYAMLALSTVQVRLSKVPILPPSEQELSYWHRALKAFTKRLSQPIDRDHADAMLATATLINGIAFAMVGGADAEHCWPFADSDLQWLRLQRGIGIVMQNTQLVAESTIFRRLFDDAEQEQGNHSEYTSPISAPSADETVSDSADCPPLAIQLRTLCRVDQHTKPHENPYLIPLSILTPFLSHPCDSAEEVLFHLGFLGSVTEEYISLLLLKDHRALLLQACFYATICKAPCWWTAARSRTECQAIVMYLEKYAWKDIVELLPFAADLCGYSLRTTLMNVSE